MLTLIAIIYLACCALVLEAAHRAPLIEEPEHDPDFDARVARFLEGRS